MPQTPDPITTLPDRPRPGHLVLLGGILMVYAAAVTLGVHRAGYSIDEEFTYFAVRGIREHGVPLLPSGALENRGLPFTYAAWISGELFGHGFPAYRYPSLLSGVIALALIFRLARIWQPVSLALLSTATVALLPWQLFSAEWARFYAMFLASYLWSLAVFWNYQRTGRGGGVWLGTVAFAHLLHDFAITLVLLPILAAIADGREPPLSWRAARLSMLAFAAFLGSELAVFALHLATSRDAFTQSLWGYAALHALPVGWETVPGAGAPPVAPGSYPLMHRRPAIDGLAAVAAKAAIGAAAGVALALLLGLARGPALLAGGLSGLGQFSRVWMVGTLWLFVRWSRAGRVLLWTVATIVLGAIIAAVATSLGSGAALTAPLVRGLVAFAFRDATSIVWGFLTYYPLTAAAFAVGAVAVALRRASRTRWFPRLLVVLVLCWLLTFDVLGVEFKPRYYTALWPLIVLVACHVPRALPIRWFQRHRSARMARLAVGFGVAATLAAEHHRVDDENRGECGPFPLICVPQMLAYDAAAITTLAAGQLRPADTVLCTDELACRYLVGRVDRWLYPGTIYAYPTGAGPVGLYGGSPIIATLDALRAFWRDAGEASRFWIVMPALRKYPSWTVEEILETMPPPLRARMQVTRTNGAIVVWPGG